MGERDQAIEVIGEVYFSTSDHCVGHADREINWRRVCVGRRFKAPQGFVFIQDAECTTVALVPVELATHFLVVLNGADLG